MLVSTISWDMQMELRLEIMASNSSCLEAAKKLMVEVDNKKINHHQILQPSTLSNLFIIMTIKLAVIVGNFFF